MIESTGLHLIVLEEDGDFAQRPLRPRDPQAQASGIAKLALACMENSETILEELLVCLMELCGAESAGVSKHSWDEDGIESWVWVATAGEVSGLTGTRYFNRTSPSSVAFDEASPYLFQIDQSYLTEAGIDAPPVSEGLVVPWRFADEKRSIWMGIHTGTEHFDRADLALIGNFSLIATQAFEYRKVHKKQHSTWAATAAAALSDALAYRINEPLREIDSLISEAVRGESRKNAKGLAQELSDPLGELKTLVSESFEPGRVRKPN